MESQQTINVLFVCLGNICRSPMAEAVFKNLVDEAGLSQQFEIQSAATSRWEIGEPIHPGTQKVLRAHGIEPRQDKRARQIVVSEMDHWDYVVAMDQENLEDLTRLDHKKIHLLMEFAPPGSPLEVPDPYYSGNFDYVYNLIERGCKGLLEYIRAVKGI